MRHAILGLIVTLMFGGDVLAGCGRHHRRGHNCAQGCSVPCSPCAGAGAPVVGAPAAPGYRGELVPPPRSTKPDSQPLPVLKP